MVDVLLIAGAFILGFALAALVAVYAFATLIDIHRDETQAVRAEREQWRSERRELLNRVQHPQVMPTGVQRAPRDPDELARQRNGAREWASVGRIGPVAGPDDDTTELDIP